MSFSKPAMTDGWEVIHGGCGQDLVNMSQKDLLLMKPAKYIDIETGDPIPMSRCLYACQELDKTVKKMTECKWIYKKIFKATHGSHDEKKAAAVMASEKHCGGGRTQIWNRLCQNKIAISLQVTAPPAQDKDEVNSNEQRLHILICQCDPSLKGMWQDIWTSPREIGTQQQSYIYVRYPYHMGEQLQRLCRALSTVNVETHKFIAKVLTEGRTRLYNTNTHEVKPWPVQINGQDLAPLSPEEIAAATKRQPDTCEERFMKNHQQHTYHLEFQKSIVGEDKAAKELIWAPDWQNIQSRNQTKLYAQKLASKGEMDSAEAYFMISGLVIDAASMGMKAPGPHIFFYRCNAETKYCDDAENLFMSTSFGDTILALDAPFKLTFGEATEGSNLDADDGIWAVDGFKYEVDDDTGIVFKHAGITMV